jgi:hypothetical protein
MILTDPDNGKIHVTFETDQTDKSLIMAEGVKRITGIDYKIENNNYFIFLGDKKIEMIVWNNFKKGINSIFCFIGDVSFINPKMVMVSITTVKNRHGEDITPADFLWENRKSLFFQKMDVSV